MRRKIIFETIALVSLILVLAPFLTAQTVTINMEQEHQIIRGFGGMNHTSWIQDLSPSVREKAFQNDPGNLGLSILRIHIDPDTNRFIDQVATAKYAHNQGVKVIASPWDPPAHMTETVGNQTKLQTDMYDDYVEHLNQFNTFMANKGVPLYALSVQNEPDYGEWTRWTSAEMVTFLRENAQHIENRVIAPESFQFRRAFTDPILQDSIACSHLDIVGGHIYGGGDYEYPLAREKDKEVWMTEHYTTSDRSANLWPDALVVGEDIHNCMIANFNSYIWWYVRRYYGLITDDGLISKRGYVMSQYSKFIRPGSKRVDATVSDVPNLHVTAYKTDSSLVIVALNKNTETLGVDFSIENSIVDSLIQFTTSGNKSVVNEGGVSISDSSFHATLEPNSITTFTSHAQNGGRYGNMQPLAVAGDDVALNDNDADGFETIKLDASSSSDADGEIVDIVWSMNGDYLSSDTTYNADVPLGENMVVLTVIDNDGTPAYDTMKIIVNSIYDTEIWVEAECANVGSTWNKEEGTEASNGKYITSPDGNQYIDAASNSSNDYVQVEFEVTETANYKVWCRVISPSADDDSYWIRMDGNSWIMWNSIPSSSEWHWDDVHDGSDDNPVSFDLAAGKHTLDICIREDGVLLDKILIVNSGKIPTDQGGEAENCSNNNNNTNLTKFTCDNSSIKLFPNPVRGHVQINWMPAFNQIQIHGMDGKIMLNTEYPSVRQIVQLPIHLESGIYFIQVANEYKSAIAKLIVE